MPWRCRIWESSSAGRAGADYADMCSHQDCFFTFRIPLLIAMVALLLLKA